MTADPNAANIAWWSDPRVLDDTAVRRLPVGERVVRTVPTARRSWADVSSDLATRALLNALCRAGFGLNGVHEGHAYFTVAGPGKYPTLAVLTVDEGDPSRVVGVRVGRRSMTAWQAARWLWGLA